MDINKNELPKTNENQWEIFKNNQEFLIIVK